MKINNMYKDEYLRWVNNPSLDKELLKELKEMSEEEKEDSFYKTISFGTAGLRGIIGAGSNRMNIYTLRRANFGYAKFLRDNYAKVCKRLSVVIARDNRYMGEEFVRECVRTLATFNIKCFIFDKITPTPVLSFAIRYLKADGGIVVTASHNPPKYNGYKIYDNSGCQLVPVLAREVVDNVNNAKDYFDIEVKSYDEVVSLGLVEKVGKTIEDEYVKMVEGLSINHNTNKALLKIVFTPLHGTSGNIGSRILTDKGYDFVKVEEQFINDPSFPTVKYPNPEDKDAFSLAIKYAKNKNADICIATDPDADRIGVAVKDKNNEIVYLDGNQTGAILIDYICKYKTLPKFSVLIDTIVTSPLGRKIAQRYGVETISTYTGFKFIAQQIKTLENTNKTFIFGYEESYGYLLSDAVRDKDSLQALLLICEVASFYKEQNKTLTDVLEDIQKEYGYFSNGLISITLDGSKGLLEIKKIMDYLRNNDIASFSNMSILQKTDYSKTDLIINSVNLEKSDVIKFDLPQDTSIIFRPSGTEPKLKAYIMTSALSKESAQTTLNDLKKSVNDLINNILK